MNKLINDFNRGFSLKNDDLRFVDASIRLAFADAIKAHNITGSVILFGCAVSVSGTTASVAEGAIFHDDEIWHVDEHTFTVPDPLVDSPNWCFVASWDAAGAKTDVDLNPHNTYQVRKAVGNMANDITGTISYASMEDVHRLTSVNNSIAQLTAVSGAKRSGRTVDCRAIKRGDMVTIDAGYDMLLLNNSFITVATIPASYRPAEQVEGIIPGYDNADPANPHVVLMYQITTSGNIQVKRMVALAAAAAVSFNLNLPAYSITA